MLARTRWMVRVMLTFFMIILLFRGLGSQEPLLFESVSARQQAEHLSVSITHNGNCWQKL